MRAERPQTSIDRVSDLFRAQRGVVERSQAIEFGLSAAQISRALSSGKWIRALPRVYRLATAPVTWEQSVLAACLAGGPGTVASHRCAGALHGLDGLPMGEIEVWSPRRLRAAGMKCHSGALSGLDPTVVRGIPATSIERTLVDLAACLYPEELEVALDSALRERKSSLARLRWRVQQTPRHGAKGVGTLRSLLEERSTAAPASESALETRLLRIITRSGLPLPERQHRVMDGDRVVGRFDFAYQQSRLIIEVDGYRWHSGNQAWQRDRRRDNDLNRLGWTVLRYTAADLKFPEDIVRQIRAVLFPTLDV